MLEEEQVHKTRLFVLSFIVFGILCVSAGPAVWAQDDAAAGETQVVEEPFLTPEMTQKLELYIEKQMKAGKIPGLAIAVVKGDKTEYIKGFGLADREKKTPVTPKTLFELGSTSKAFTALGILKLAGEGKLNLKDPVSRYLPWFTVNYNGEAVNVSIGQFLHQTSGIPFETIGDIPVASGDDALEETVKTLVGQSLMFPPGMKFFYATINYDVLGLVIQTVSGMPYEDYMKQEVLGPLGLEQTMMYRSRAREKGMASGYKVEFDQVEYFDAPDYRGNTPAGYVITNAEDMARWLKIQLGAVELESFDAELIKKSHSPNPGGFDSPYAKGWFLYKRMNAIGHGGNNPNFSSFILFKPEANLGVAVLANLSSSTVTPLAMNVMRILEGEQARVSSRDQNMQFDRLSIMIIYGVLAITAVFFLLFIFFFVGFRKKGRAFNLRGFKGMILFVIVTLVFLAIEFALFNLPALIYAPLPWAFIHVWMPISFIYAVLALGGLMALIYIYTLLKIYFPRPKKG